MSESDKKQSMFAFRTWFFIFVCIMLSLIAIVSLLKTDLPNFIVSISLFIALCLYMFSKKGFPVLLFTLGICLICGSGIVCNFNNYNKGIVNEEEKFTITGRADETFVQQSSGFNRVLYNCEISHNGSVLFTNKTISVYLYGGNIECGDKITFSAKLKNVQFFSVNGLNENIYKGINYSTQVAYDDIQNLEKTDLTLKEVIKLRALTILNNNLDSENAMLAYAIVFGDKSCLDYDLKQAFTMSGLAHVLAVSGLHTGIIFMLLLFLMKRLKIKYGVKLGIISIILLLFTYICNFSPSIVRASIMAIVLSFTYLTSQKNDALNVLGLAGIIILLTNATQLWNIGFVLSFTCMFALIVFSNFWSKKFSNVRQSGFKDIFVASIVTGVCTLPCMAHYFSSFSLISAVTNVLVLPIITSFYALIFLFLMISLIIPLTPILYGINIILGAVVNLTSALASVNLAYIKILTIGTIGLICSFMLFFAFSQKTNIKKVPKIITCTFLTCIVCFSCVYCNIPKIDNNSITKINSLKVCVANFDNKVSAFDLLSSSTDLYEIKEFLREKRIKNFESLFLLKYNFIQDNKLKSFFAEFDVGDIYVAEYAFEDYKPILNEYCKDSNVTVLYDDKEYQTKTFSFKYNLIKQDSCFISINYDNAKYVVYSTSSFG